MRGLGKFLVTTAIGGLALAAPDVCVRAQTIEFQPDRLIVEFRHRISMGDVDSLLGGNGFVAEKSLRDSVTYLVRIPNGWSMETALDNVTRRESVASSGYNYYCRLPEASQVSQAFLDADADPYSPGVSPDEFYVQYAVATTQMSLGHLMGTGSGLVIADIDNGVDFDHSLLSARLLPGGYDYVDDDSDPAAGGGEYAGHGTFVAGLLALAAPDAAILPIRSLDGDGRGTVFDIVQGIDLAIVAAADVVAMGFSLTLDDHFLHAAVLRMEAADILAVAPAGNEDSDGPHYPAAYASVIGVGAVDSLDLRAGFSNFGPSVDLCTPGVSLYSALPGDGDVWGQWSGTSFSAPLAAGLAAAIRQLHPSAPAAACRCLLAWGADAIDSLNLPYAGALGAGRINFARSAGYGAPVVAVWGVTTNTVGVGQAGVQLELMRDGQWLESSRSISDSLGGFTLAAPAGVCDLRCTPPPTSGYGLTQRLAVPLLGDTSLAIVLNGLARGDLNLDGVCDLVDVASLINVTFRGVAPPTPELLADVTCDAVIDVRDVVGLINHAFRGAPAPWCP